MTSRVTSANSHNNINHHSMKSSFNEAVKKMYLLLTSYSALILEITGSPPIPSKNT